MIVFLVVMLILSSALAGRIYLRRRELEHGRWRRLWQLDRVLYSSPEVFGTKTDEYVRLVYDQDGDPTPEPAEAPDDA